MMTDQQSSPVSAPADSAAARQRFDDFGLAPEILRALRDQGYEYPTPIQAQAIPVVLQGRDVMGAAQTGTGKTAGFSLPIIQRLMAHANNSASPARHPVRALILTPTRELADQVAENVKAYSRHTGLRATVVFGGVDIAPQVTALRSGVEIVIATPGRLLDHVAQKSINLSQTQILVMDEADRMLDMGFLPDLQRIINLLPRQRQNLMFSATFSPEIKKLAASFLSNPQTIEVARSNATSDNVTQILYEVKEDEKRDAIAFILRERGLKQVIVFTNTKIGASRLSVHLVKQGVKAAAIHGDKSQSERMTALEDFKRGAVEVLVATDVAARGLDISEMPCVINYDLPFNAEDYVHRIGRTGRAGAKGDAISLCGAQDDKALADIEKLTGRKIVRLQLAGFVPTSAPAFREREHRSEYRGDQRSENRHEQRGEGRSRGGYGAAREKVDPWFLRPYTPNTAPASARNEKSAAANNTAAPKPQKRAALLGGLRKTSVTG
ncbi:ATP-dependent RNA helicase RhlE [Undibacterium squillarum]|uniref:ATP-dependent RNA helicase RhlE n=2 Tax=Undibacterium squillarum TaxID=1131567 RepID=A0ABQ2XTZ4_9BURK|nr:ATP-dependent RNA helicase RhlE [Undibacterium squillarum]